MRIKSYYAQTIPEAMKQARIELGEDAVIIASSKTSGETQRLGAYEVVFGITEQSGGASKTAAPESQATAGLDRLKDRMENLRKSVTSKREQVVAAKANVSAKLASALVNTGFPKPLADEIASAAQTRLRERKQDMISAVRAELAGRVKVSPKLGTAGQSRSIVALVGPSGSGKTTTIAKLAAGYGLAAGRPLRLISMDTYRIGGTDLLSKYAGGMGLDLETPANPEDLERRLRTGSKNELLLIDTPAPRPGDTELAPLLARSAGIDVHLVLPAYASAGELGAMAAKFKAFLPSKLLFTGVDQCASGASMLAYAIEAGLPVSFTGCGQEVPEDLEEASASSLMSRVLPGLIDAAASAA